MNGNLWKLFMKMTGIGEKLARELATIVWKSGNVRVSVASGRWRTISHPVNG